MAIRRRHKRCSYIDNIERIFAEDINRVIKGAMTLPYEAKLGEVCLFENEKAGNARAPDHRGYFVAHRDIKAGEKIAIAIWNGSPDSPRSFRGTASDISKAGIVEADLDLFGRPVISRPHGST